MGYEYVIDSSAWLEYIAGTPKGMRVRKLIEDAEIATSIIGVFELADKFERDRLNFETCLKFIRSRAEILPITVDIALNAAKLKNEIRKENGKFGASDSIHLATSLSERATFVTADNDFKGIENVMLI